MSIQKTYKRELGKLIATNGVGSRIRMKRTMFKTNKQQRMFFKAIDKLPLLITEDTGTTIVMLVLDGIGRGAVSQSKGE